MNVDFVPSLTNLTDLESTRHLGLEHTLRIVFFRDAANVLHVLGTIAGKWVLAAVCVVKVDVLIVSPN